MSDYGASEILDALMKNLQQIISTKTIVGDPVQAGSATILPVMRVSLGFAAGAGTGANPKQQGGGGGGGGGLSITPIGFLVVEDGRATMITPKSSKWDWVAESIPDLIERLVNRSRGTGNKKDSSPESFESDQQS